MINHDDLPSYFDGSYPHLTDFEQCVPAGYLPGGARTVACFDASQLQEVEPIKFVARVNDPLPDSVPAIVSAAVTKARLRFPGQAIDVEVLKESYTAGDPGSFSPVVSQVHADGFSFLVMSSDEPTVFYDGPDGTNPRQALPGALVEVLPNGSHSSPTPTDTGERVRAKFIPLSNSGSVLGGMTEKLVFNSLSELSESPAMPAKSLPAIWTPEA
jgi:hypothetical protein